MVGRYKSGYVQQRVKIMSRSENDTDKKKRPDVAEMIL